MVQKIRILKLLIKIFLWLLLAAALVCVSFSVVALIRERHDNEAIAPKTGTYIQAGDIRLFVQTAGDKSDTPILLIHGMASWSETWRPVMDMLVQDNWYVIAVDMPPFGFSDRPASHDYWRTAQADRLDALLTNMDISSAYIVGHSYGSRSVLEFAMQFPARVRGLVLVDPALSGIYGPVAAPSGLMQGLFSIAPLRYSLTAATLTNPLLTRTLLGLFLYDKQDATDEILAIYTMPARIKKSTSDLGFWMQGFVANEDTGLSSDVANYAKIRVPVALIWGEEDTTTPLEQGQKLQTFIPGSKLFTMPGIGHIPQIEDITAFNDVLRKALTEIQ